MKSKYKSKTILFGLLIIVVAVANFFGYAEYVPSPEDAETVDLIKGIVLGAIAIFLRFKTTEPIG